MKKLLISLLSLAMLTACAPSRGLPSPDLTFENYPVQSITASFITIERPYDPFQNKKDIAMQMAVPPHVALERYLNHRLKADGSQTDSLRITIEDGQVTAREIKQENKYLSMADIGTQDEYTVRMKIKIQPHSQGNIPGAGIEHRFERTLIMPQSVSLAEREMRQVKFIEKMIADMDQKIMASLRNPLRMIP